MMRGGFFLGTMVKMKKVFVGLSGGVDSAVSAALLKERGFDVTGVFIKVWQPDFLPCTWRDERRDAMKVTIALDIPFLFFDFSDEYKKGVVDRVISDYKRGLTPNPDVLCNKEIKFGSFLRKAKEMGADYIATGHYAKIENGKLLEGTDKEKDQSYFLWSIPREDLSHIIFSLGGLEKSEVRKLARKFSLPVAEKKDSQGICFIGNVEMSEFLSHFFPSKPGKVLDTAGEVIGSHGGVVFYTIGERRGFQITKKKPEAGAFYVVAKDVKTNTLTVSNREPEIVLLSPKGVFAADLNIITEPSSNSLTARIRYRGEKVPVRVKKAGKGLEVRFENPMKGLSLGQSIVFYEDEACLGGGVMEKIL